MDDLVNRLNGIYRIPITDGLGPAGGEEPNNPNEFVRTYETPPIQKEAAARISALEAENKRLREAIKPFADEAENLVGWSDEDLLPIAEAESEETLTVGMFRRAKAELEGDQRSKALDELAKIDAEII